MSDAFVGEIRAFPYNYVPLGWAECNGQSMAIQQYEALYSVIGNTYGNGTTTSFILPDLRGRATIGTGQGPGLDTDWAVGEQGGTETVELSTGQIPVHAHALEMEVVTTGFQTNMTATPVAGSSWLSHPLQLTGAAPVSIPSFTKPATGVDVDTTLHQATVGVAGSDVPHENRQPYQTLMYCICFNGVYPMKPQ